MKLDYELVQTPPMKKPMFNEGLQKQMDQAQMANVKKFTPFQESQAERGARDMPPFDMAASDAHPSAIKKSDAIGMPYQPKNSLVSFAQDVDRQRPFRMSSDLSGRDYPIEELKLGKPKPRQTEKCQ